MGSLAKVLIVDDSQFMRMYLENIVVDSGLSVIGYATDGLDAIEKYKELSPDIVTMDLTMGNADGIYAITEILKYNADAKIIVVSAFGREDILKKCVELGVKEFIFKPINKKLFLDTLTNLANDI